MARRSTVALSVLLVLVALGVGGWYVHQELESRRAMELAKAAGRAAAEKQAKAAAQAQARLFTDPGPSQWLQQGVAPLWSALVKSKSAVLVIPPGNPEDRPGLDVTARVAFARALVDSLPADAAALLPDPGFALAAIGEPRAIDEGKLVKLLSQTSIASLVTGAFEMEPGRVSVELRRTYVQTGARKTFQAKVDIGAGVLPEQALAGIASQAMRALEFETSPRAQPSPAAAPDLALPASPLAATTDAVDPQTGVWLQQLFGILYSPHFLADPRARERMFERSLWSLTGVDVASGDRAVLEARALAYLGRRDAALRILGAAPASPEQAALRAYLNAALPELKKAVGGIRRPVARLIAELELLSVRGEARELSQESRRAELQRIVQSVPEPWQMIVTLHGLSSDPWSYPPAYAVKPVLERDFPVPGYGMQEILRGRAALGANPQDLKLEAEMMLSPLVHARKWREQNLEALCCARLAARGHRPFATDYLGLLENHADALLLARLYFLREVQGNAQHALATAKLYDELLFAGGHPGVLMQRGAGFVPGSAGQQDPRSYDEVFDAARKIRAWIGYQSKAASWAARYWESSIGRAAIARGVLRSPQEVARTAGGLPLSGDVPARDVYLVDLASALSMSPTDKKEEKAALRTACAIAVDFYYPCEAYATVVQSHGQAEERAQVEVLLRGRFIGYSEATEKKVHLLLEQGRSAESKLLLREAIRTTPSAALHALLGAVLTDEGAYDEAAAVYASLPALKGGGGNTVELSNYLRRAARRLLARGAAAQARPLMEAAASHSDASHANLEAGVYAAHWRGDGELALQWLGALYQRYPNGRTLGEVASMTFALGDQNAGWSVLETAPAGSPDFASFAAAAVGMRREGTGVSRLLAWANAGRPGIYSWYLASAFRVLALDRGPASLDRVVEAERPLRLKFPGNYSHGVAAGAQHAMTAEDNALAWRATVDGYRGLLLGEFAAAADALSHLLARFDATGLPQGLDGPENFWAMMPYTSYALVKAGRGEQASKMLERFDEARQQAAGRKNIVVKRAPAFESHLVAAVIAALSGNHTEGMRSLRLAQANVPENANARLIPEDYLFAEVAEWLGRDTGNAAYVAVALDFARARQRFEPWAAWSYAFEATHSRDQAARVRAAAIAMWLDPESRRLMALPAALKAAAKQSLQVSPPFRRTAGGRREGKA